MKGTIEVPLIRYRALRMVTILKKILMPFELLLGFFGKGMDSHNSALNVGKQFLKKILIG